MCILDADNDVVDMAACQGLAMKQFPVLADPGVVSGQTKARVDDEG